MKKKVNINDLTKSFGCSDKEISENLIKKFDSIDLNYETIEGEQLEKLYIEIVDKIITDKQIIGDFSRTQVWENGWKENLDDYSLNPQDYETLIPKFIRPGKPIRFFRNFIKPENEMFELDYFSIYRQWLFENYFKNFDNIYEFGCGTGFNLLELSKIYPNKNLYGSDFVQSSVDLVNLIGKKNSINLESELFDLINPNFDYVIKPNSLICTFGALEQIDSKFENFLKFIFEKKPSLIIHTEPVLELYDTNNFNDYLAYSFQKKRGYTNKYLPYLKDLSENNKIELIKIQRLEFGSTMMEGFNLIVWKINNNI